MELVASQEEAEFLRARQSTLYEEENRLQMVTQMSKRLGTNVSKYELDALKLQVASLTQEAERVQATNARLQSDLKVRGSSAESVESLKADVHTFQLANDQLEARILLLDRHVLQLQQQVRAMEANSALVDCHLRLLHRLAKPCALGGGRERRCEAHGAELSLTGTWPGPLVERVESSNMASAQRATAHPKMPLLWGASSPATSADRWRTHSMGGGPSAEWAELYENSARDGLPQRPVPPPPGGRTQRLDGRSMGALASAPVVSGSAQRAVTLLDAVTADPVEVISLPKAAGRLTRPFISDACHVLRVRDNSCELAAATATQTAGNKLEARLVQQVCREHVMGQQEVQLVRASATAMLNLARTAKLGSMRLFHSLKVMRALYKWALLLKVEGLYAVALEQAVCLIADHLVASHDEASRHTVCALLLQPANLGELGQVRRQHEFAIEEAEALRVKLLRLVGKSVSGTDELGEGFLTGMLQTEAAGQDQNAMPGKRDATAGVLLTVQRQLTTATTAAVEVGVDAAAVSFKLRILRHHCRASRRLLDRQLAVLRHLSQCRDEEREAAAVQAARLARAQMQLTEMRGVERRLRAQAAEQIQALGTAISSASLVHEVCEEDVAVLSSKLGHVMEGRGIQALEQPATRRRGSVNNVTLFACRSCGKTTTL